VWALPDVAVLIHALAPLVPPPAQGLVHLFLQHLLQQPPDSLLRRPGRNPHKALDALYAGLLRRKVNGVLDLDIRDFLTVPTTR
jgi:hypothetical protein